MARHCLIVYSGLFFSVGYAALRCCIITFGSCLEQEILVRAATRPFPSPPVHSRMLPKVLRYLPYTTDVVDSCLFLACTGMAYPPPRPDDDGNLPAEIPLEGVIPLTLAHRDMHDGNLMFDRLDPKHREHSLVPVVKLIDFDRATLMPDQVVAPKDNEIASFDGLLNLSQLWPISLRGTKHRDR
ncbi:hypothetical protein F5X96DRAFT_417343 [Biscogniauxia mediterranea]|nr:hypothetical protein F5X96DRAFT_417343 [Biscogniauxia mediterranea]